MNLIRKTKALATGAARFLSPRKSTVERVIMAAGIALIAWGLFQIYCPLAPIFVGIVIVAEVLTASPRENE